MDEKTRGRVQGAVRRRRDNQRRSNALERRFTIPERNRAIVREFREVVEKGYPVRTACSAHATGARRSYSLSASAMPRPWRTCSTCSLQTRSRTRRPGMPTLWSAASERTTRSTRARSSSGSAGGLPENPGQREHARHRLRLPGSRQPGHGALHQVGRSCISRCAGAAPGRPITSTRPASRSSTSSELRLPRRRRPVASAAVLAIGRQPACHDGVRRGRRAEIVPREADRCRVRLDRRAGPGTRTPCGRPRCLS